MKKLTDQEIKDFIAEWTWGTLVAVDGDEPYAVEVAYASDGENLYCGSMPGGKMSQCIRKNPNVLFKICESDKKTMNFRAVTIKGRAERLTKKEDILAVLRRITKKVGMPEKQLDPIAENMAKIPDKSNCLKIPFTFLSGRSTGKPRTEWGNDMG